MSDDIGEVSVSIDKEICKNNRRETRRHNSFENMPAQGSQMADESADIVSFIEKQETNKTLKDALDKLLPQQRELIQKVFVEGVSVSDIAREQGVDKSAISHRLNRIYQQLQKLHTK